MQDDDGLRLGVKSPHGGNDGKAHEKLSSSSIKVLQPQHAVESSKNELSLSKTNALEQANESSVVEEVSREISSPHQPPVPSPSIQKSSTISNGPEHDRNRTGWGRTAVSLCLLDW